MKRGAVECLMSLEKCVNAADLNVVHSNANRYTFKSVTKCKQVTKAIWQEAASPSCHIAHRGGQCIRSLRALGRHSRPRRSKLRRHVAQRVERLSCGQRSVTSMGSLYLFYVTMRRHIPPQKCPFPRGI